MEIKMMTDLDGILPKTIEFNYKELDEQLNEMLEKYKGKEKTDASNYKKRKDERAQLNKLSSALDGVRKDVKKRLLAVMEDGQNDDPSFSDKIKSLVGLVNMVSGEIDNGIKEYEEGVREQLRNNFTKVIDTLAKTKLDEKWYSLSKNWLASWANEQMTRKKGCWLNIGVDENAVCMEIQQEIDRILKQILAVSAMFTPDDEEITHVKSENALAVRFDATDGITAINESRESIRRAKEREEEKRRIELQKMSETITPMPNEKGEIEKESQVYSCEMRFVGTMSAFQNLKDYLKMNKDISYVVTRSMEAVTK